MSFSTKQYQWSDITLVIAGLEIEGVTNIKFGGKREKDYLFGRGDEAIEIQNGNISYSGELELWHSVVEELMAVSPEGDITLLRVAVTVSFAQKYGDKISIYNIPVVEFEEFNFEVAQGDKDFKVSLPIKMLGLKKVA